MKVLSRSIEIELLSLKMN